MALSKRLRYEILRRDNHTCRYCGATAPDVELTVDHVVPVSLGGLDDPSNLVAACRDCNAGKTSSSPDAVHVEQVADDALRWAEALKVAADELRVDAQRRTDIYDRVNDRWYRGNRPADWTDSIDQFISAGLPEDIILNLVDVAQNKRGEVGYRWSYFCGCCWRRVRDLQHRAAELSGVTRPAAESEPDEWIADVYEYVEVVLQGGLAGKAFPADEQDQMDVLRERFSFCRIHQSFDCVDERCAATALIAGCVWAETSSLKLLRELTLAKHYKSERRRAMRTAYRAGFEDAIAGRSGNHGA